MKKFLKRTMSLCLTAVLLCSQLPAALAADTTPPLYEQFGCDSAQDFMDSWFYRDVSYDWICERYAIRFGQLRQNPDLAFESAYQGWDWGMVDEYFSTREDFLRDAALQLVVVDSFAFVPPLSVQLNGKTVTFPDAQPEQHAGRTMVPLRALLEELGGTVGYADGTVTAAANGRTISFRLGSSELSVTDEKGSQQTQKMDIAPYEKNGRTYVPARFFAEAFNLTVQWDEERQTAVLYDRAALLASVDARFTAFNQWLAAQPKADPAQAMRTALGAKVTYTAFNSIDGNTVYPMSGSVEMVSNEGGCEMKVEADIYALIQLLFGEQSWLYDEKIVPKLEKVKNELQNVSFEAIIDLDSNVLYFRCPEIFRIMNELEPGSVPTIAANAWLKTADVIDADTMDYMELFEQYGTLTSEPTVGAMLLASEEMQSGQMSGAALWSNVQNTASALEAVVGDGALVRSGDRYTFTLDETNEPQSDEWFAGTGYAKGTMTFNVKTGAAEGAFEWRATAYDTDTLITLSFKGNAADASARLSIHSKNESLTEVELYTSVKSAAQPPRKAPAEGSVIVDVDAWMNALTGQIAS